jgi:hypothetical protein
MMSGADCARVLAAEREVTMDDAFDSLRKQAVR